VNDNGDIHCAFLIGKARLAPLKIVTIPRLELTAAVLSVRIGILMLKELDLPIERHEYWTDSQTVIRYIINEEKRFQVFVANRVQTIRDHTNCKQWHYVEGGINPADDGSRDLTVKQFLEKGKLLTGPKFLWQPESEWPQCGTDLNADMYDDPEVKKTTVCATIVVNQIDVLKRFEYFSQWNHLKAAIAWILRMMPKRIKQDSKITTSTLQSSMQVLRPLTVEEV
jgi:hypothetical protein